MSKLKCFDNIKIPSLEKQFRSMVKDDMSLFQEKVIGVQIATDYYKTLNDELNKLKEEVGVKQVVIEKPEIKPIPSPKVPEKVEPIKTLAEELNEIEGPLLTDDGLSAADLFGNMGKLNDDIMNTIAKDDTPLSNAENIKQNKKDC